MTSKKRQLNFSAHCERLVWMHGRFVSLQTLRNYRRVFLSTPPHKFLSVTLFLSFFFPVYMDLSFILPFFLLFHKQTSRKQTCSPTRARSCRSLMKARQSNYGLFCCPCVSSPLILSNKTLPHWFSSHYCG